MKNSEKKIIVAVDFSDASKAALETGLEFAKMHDSELIILHVIETVSPIYEILVDNNTNEKKRQASTKKLAEWEAALETSGVKVSKLYEEGRIHEEIIKAADHHYAEMVVMGLHGWHHSGNEPAGSTVVKVIRGTSCPVVTVKDSTKMSELKKILIPVDSTFGIRELRKELEIYHNSFNPEVTVMCVNDKDTEHHTELENHLKRQEAALHKQGITNVITKVVDEKVVSKAIIDEVTYGEYDMVWMETHGRRGLSNLFLGSTTEEVMSNVNIPVLSLKPEREPLMTHYSSPNLPI